MNKKVYIAMSADLIHNGHINVINEGTKLGDVYIGLLTDEAISSYKRLPLLPYDDRKKIFENIRSICIGLALSDRMQRFSRYWYL